MSNDYVKKLTGKDPKDFEFAAAHIINDCDVEAFSALVEKSDFLFDFIKKNVEKRLSNVITNYNYRNLLPFLKIYSPDYEDFIVSTLVSFANEEIGRASCRERVCVYWCRSRWSPYHSSRRRHTRSQAK